MIKILKIRRMSQPSAVNVLRLLDHSMEIDQTPSLTSKSSLYFIGELIHIFDQFTVRHFWRKCSHQ